MSDKDIIQVENKRKKAVEMAQWLRVSAAFLEDLSSVPSSYIERLLLPINPDDFDLWRHLHPTVLACSPTFTHNQK